MQNYDQLKWFVRQNDKYLQKTTITSNESVT